MSQASLSTIPSPARLAALRRLGLLDTPASPAFDRLTRLAARVLHAPVALVSLVDADRQFFKSAIGLAEPWATQRETPLSHSFCRYVVEAGEPLIIADARTHPLLYANPAILDMGVVAYAGMPLITFDGQRLGSFCVIDHQPRTWTPDEIDILRDLAASVLTEIELLADMIERTQAEATAQRLAEQRKRLLDVAQTVVSSLALDEILPQLQRTLQLVVAHDALSIYWLDTATGFLRPGHQVAPTWISDQVGSWPIPINSGIAGAVVRSGRAEMVNNAQFDPRSVFPPGTPDPPEHHQISIPLQAHDQVRGVFLISRTSSEPFTDQEFELAQIFMSFASLAIENARLFEQTKLAEERQRLLIEQVPCRLWTTDYDLRYTSSVGQPTQELRTPHKSVIGMSIYELFKTDDPQMPVIAAHRRALAGESSAYDLTWQGRVFQTHVHPFRDVHGQVTGCIGVALDITERREVEEALRESEDRARRLSEVAFEGIAIHEHGIILDANQALATLLGYERDELIGMPVLDFTAPESRDRITANIRTGSVLPYEVLGLRKDGSRIMAEIQSKPISYHGQSIRVAAIRDITERKQAEAALRESEDRYRTFFEHSIDAILLTSPDGSIFAANPAACRIFGRSEAEMCQVGRQGVIDANDPRLVIALEQRARTGSFKGELTFLRQDGARFPGELSTALFKDRDGLVKTSMIIRDITERKRAEEALRESQTLLQGIVDHAPMIIVIQDIADGRYLLVNRTLEIVTGRTVEQLLGKTLAELYPPDAVALWRAQDRRIASTHQALQVEDDIRHSDGTLHTSLGIKFPIYDTKGAVYAIGGIFTDITERKRAEHEREQLIAALQEALANIKTLRGLLPICASCKKIRDDSGYWSQIEAYVQEHSDAVFSHGICPDCARRLYGDIFEE